VTSSEGPGSTVRKRVFISAPEVIDIVAEPLPVLAPHEALVSLLVSGVCGSDLHGLHSTHPTMKPPYYPGHEVVGVVREIGGEVTTVKVGQRVTPEPPLPCGNCKMCRTERSNLCENLQFFGCGFREGGMADVFSIRADRLHVVPGGFDLRQAALIEPLSTPVHAARLAGDLTGKAVAIIGCGTVGLLMLAVARAHGARKVVVTDVLANKRVGALARGGTVVIVGVPSRPVEVPIFLLQDRQIRLQGATTSVAEDYAEAMEIIASGAVDAGTMVTASFPLERARDAFAAAASGKHLKVLVTSDGLSV
jgi:threonine dehydrogenase-like Zn-dependent dehydrogenase